MQIEDLLADLSDQIWRFIEDAPFRPREETLTEILLLEMCRQNQVKVWIQKASVAQEVEKGLDWAWAINTTKGWLHLVVQAKQIAAAPNGVYLELQKTKKARAQAQKLINGAGAAGALPLFAFFNSSVQPFGTAGTPVEQGACGARTVWRDHQAHAARIPGTSPLGVTLAHAQDVLDYGISKKPHTSKKPNTANTSAFAINKYAMPWECLFCPNWTSPPPDIDDSARASGCAVKLAQILRGSPIDVEWMSESPPLWATKLMEDGDLRVDESRPRAAHFVALDPLV